MVNKFFPPKRLSILAGISSIGKTTFAARLGDWLCRNGESVFYLSMGDEAKYIYDNIGHGSIGNRLKGDRFKGHFFVSDMPMSIEELHLAMEKHNFGVIIIDDLELMNGLDELMCFSIDVERKHIIHSLRKYARLYKNRIIVISHRLRRQTISFEEWLPYMDDRMSLSMELTVINGNYHMQGYYVPDKKKDKMELIQYHMRTEDSKPVPISYVFTYV